MLRRHNRGQSTLEFTLLITLVIGALLAMQLYMKRGVEGKLRSNTDSIGEQFELGSTQINHKTERTGTQIQTYGLDGDLNEVDTLKGATGTVIQDQIEEFSGSEDIDAW